MSSRLLFGSYGKIRPVPPEKSSWSVHQYRTRRVLTAILTLGCSSMGWEPGGPGSVLICPGKAVSPWLSTVQQRGRKDAVSQHSTWIFQPQPVLNPCVWQMKQGWGWQNQWDRELWFSTLLKAFALSSRKGRVISSLYDAYWHTIK